MTSLRDATDSPETPSLARRCLPYLWPTSLVITAIAVSVTLLLNLGSRESPTPAAATVAPSTAPPRAVAAVDDDAQECRENTAAQLAKVSIGQQKMWLCDRGTLVRSSPITTGRSATGHGTPLGTWTVNSRETNRYLSGPGYRVYVHYWLPFFEDFGFHDSPWQKFPYGDTVQYKTGGSQGCVHVPKAAMAALYRWANVGTVVTVVA